jgi:F-type H+-transporting ATPase subunit alpha
MKSVAGTLRLDLAQYNELKAFAAFASDLDPTSRAQLDRGERLTELLKQPQSAPLSVGREVVSIWSGTTGELDEIPVADVRRFEQEFLSHLRHNRKEILDAIGEKNDLPDDTAEALKEAITHFKQSFLAGETRPVQDAPATPSDASSDNHERVTREVRHTEGG